MSDKPALVILQILRLRIRLCAHLYHAYTYILLASLHDQNKSGFFGGPAFIQPIRTI